MGRVLAAWRTPLLLAFLCAFFVALTFPGFQFPVVSDTIIYALTGQSFWTTGHYALFGEPHAKYLPLFGILSYPLVWAFGMQVGMKVASIAAGCGVLVVTYFLLRRAFSQQVAVLATFFLAIHHGFVFMAMVGSADPLFVLLFLASVLAYVKGSDDRRWYLPMGIAVGLACLARYNGIPLFPLFLVAAFVQRREDLKSGWFWAGLAAGGALFSIWLIRNALTFGNPLYTEYSSEWTANSLGFVSQLFANMLFYFNPLHNILLLLPFALWGMIKASRFRWLLIFAMLTAWVLTSFWWVEGMRFALAGFPILIGFAAFGLLDVVCRVPRTIGYSAITIIVLVHIAALSLYAYGSINAWFDRTVGLLPNDLHLSSEGFWAWQRARDFVDVHAESGAVVRVAPLAEVGWKGQEIFRKDLRLLSDPKNECPVYEIAQRVRSGTTVIFQTESWPVTYVFLSPCR
ncbi:MAG: glycosyltransferase family 39 protein [Candidatus Peribacteraceae bacterium]|nr:glycosyltransferase family 39 protein [Candidatus Peribacteraceae bacterium]